jgi:LEA14-like dessication related protein
MCDTPAERRQAKRICLAALACGLVTIFVSGCATASNPAAASVSLVGLRPVQAALFETTAELTLRVTNESPQALALRGSSHKIYVNDTYIGKAVSNEPLTVEPLSTGTQTVTAHLDNLALVRKVQELTTASKTTVAYRIESRFFVSDEAGGGKVSASATGELDFGGFLPSVTCQRPAVGDQRP